jgi:hypothetical protein
MDDRLPHHRRLAGISSEVVSGGITQGTASGGGSRQWSLPHRRPNWSEEEAVGGAVGPIRGGFPK